MYNYSNCGADFYGTMEEMSTIAHSYITREDITNVNDIQPHHRYFIMKASEIRVQNEIYPIMSVIYASPNELELVIDFEGSKQTESFCGSLLDKIFGEFHCVESISLIGDNLAVISEWFLIGSLLNEIFGGPIDDITFCTSLETFIIPNCVTTIESKFLCYCPLLTSIVLPDNSVTRIENKFMCACTSLKSIKIPNIV
jgi:hypothetical protein